MSSMRLFKNLFAFVVIPFILLISRNSDAKIVVFVPGYFSTLSPHYINGENISNQTIWSLDIVNVFEKAGFKVYVVNNLNPTGSIEENAEHLLQFISKIKLLPNEKIQVLAYSAGGLYVIYANDKRLLPIKKMVSIATPYEGLEFIDQMSQDFPAMLKIEKYLNMESLNQLKPENVKNLMSKIRNRPQFLIYAFQGFQSRNYQKQKSAMFLSPVFYITEMFMSEPSDGIVTSTSALSRAGFDGESYGQASDLIRLDHWKQTSNANKFIKLGMVDTNYISKEQVRFFTSILGFFD